MGEIKIFGYILVAVLFLSIITVPLVEIFFVYRERLMLSHALYNSCRVAAEYGYKYRDMINADAVTYEKGFREAFAETFATSFGLDCLNSNEEPLKFKPKTGNAAYYNFEVKLNFDYRASNDPYADDKEVAKVTSEATSPYRFKTRLLQSFHVSAGIGYMLESTQKYDLIITN
jgi:hypothetical protein